MLHCEIVKKAEAKAKEREFTAGICISGLSNDSMVNELTTNDYLMTINDNLVTINYHQ